MKLSVENNRIILFGIDSLKKYQVSQLEYYGYISKSNTATKATSSIQSDLLTLLNYLKGESVIFELTDVAKEIIDSATKQKAAFDVTFNKAEAIKNGNIDQEEFLDFQKYLNSLPRSLKSHQIKSAYHLYILKNGANFSVPGSGKTSVVLSVYEKFKIEGECNILFVIGPPACFQPWKTEFELTLGRYPSSVILSGGSKELRKSEYYKTFEDTHELYLTTFQTVLNDYTEIIKFLSQQKISAFVVIDEAHYMKQIGGSWANSLLQISKYASFKCILTGTPIPKSYKDVYNLFDFLWQENSPLTESNKIQIDVWEKKKKTEEAKQLLQEKIGPLFYRVRKKDLGLIPPVFHEPIKMQMNTHEKLIYAYIKSRVMELSEEDYFKNEEALNKLWRGRMIRLRQTISYPKLLFSAIENYEESILQDDSLKGIITNYDQLEIPGKLQALTDLVIDLNQENQKVLIWSNFIGTLELIRSHFLKLNKYCALIYGKTPVRKDESINITEEKTREDIRDEFVDQYSGLDILIANPAACAESISLHKTCFHAIYYDLSYNCAQYIQSLDRIHRVGGSEIKQANYYFLQYDNSLDQDIKKNLETKATKMYDLIEQDFAIYNLDLYEDIPEDDIEAYKRLFINK